MHQKCSSCGCFKPPESFENNKKTCGECTAKRKAKRDAQTKEEREVSNLAQKAQKAKRRDAQTDAAIEEERECKNLSGALRRYGVSVSAIGMDKAAAQAQLDEAKEKKQALLDEPKKKEIDESILQQITKLHELRRQATDLHSDHPELTLSEADDSKRSLKELKHAIKGLTSEIVGAEVPPPRANCQLLVRCRRSF